MSAENIEKFIAALETSLAEKTFVKMTLGNYRGSDPHLQKLLVRLVQTKRGMRLFFLYRQDTRDIVKNYEFAEGIRSIAKLLDGEFFSGHLFTTVRDHQLEIGKKGNARLNSAKATFKTAPLVEHDKQKNRLVDPQSPWLHILGITDTHGRVRDKENSKWKQINKFIETLDNLYENSALKERGEFSVVDMGSGKGYLTFAAYDHFKNTRGVDVTVTGVDTKPDMVALCNDLAKTCEFDGLRFINDTIENFTPEKVDVLIALHACNTATDEALFKGIAGNAELLIAAPCCHREIRPQIKPPEMMSEMLRHGIMLERTAETITDGLRALLLERSGYATKLFEFIATEHTPKNNMIVGVKKAVDFDREKFRKQIEDLKEFYGIEGQRLENLLGKEAGASDPS